MANERIANLVPPPRRAPLFGTINVLCGGFMNLFGWFFFGFSTIFLWAFLPNTNFDFITFSGEKIETQGTIVVTEDTHSSENKTHIIRHVFTYTDKAGVKYTGISYFTGTTYNRKDAVRVEYLLSDPKKARIVNGRSNVFGPIALIVLLFSLVGLLFILKGVNDGIRGLRLLKNGEKASGVLTGSRPTNTRINNQTVYELTFNFKVNGTEFNALASTHQTARLEDEAEEPLLYNPENPKEAIMLDSMPGNIDVNEEGELVCKFPIPGLVGFLLIAVILGGNIAYAINFFSH